LKNQVIYFCISIELILLDDLGALDEENQSKFKVNLMRLFDEIGD